MMPWGGFLATTTPNQCNVCKTDCVIIMSVFPPNKTCSANVKAGNYTDANPKLFITGLQTVLKHFQWNQCVVEGAELKGGDTPLQLLYHPSEASEFKAGSLNQFTAFRDPLILLPPICLLGI